MAYIRTEQVAAKRAALKAAFPGWKFSVRKQHHSTLIVTILSAPVDLLADRIDCPYRAEWQRTESNENAARGYADVNPHNVDRNWSGSTAESLKKIIAICNDGNHNRSDISSDYFDVGWYFSLSIGNWEKPFINTAATKAAA